MSYVHRIVALVCGILLLPVSWYVVGFVPDLLSVDVLSAPYGIRTYGIPFLLSLFVVSLIWSWMTLRPIQGPLSVAVWWCLGGLAVGFIALGFHGYINVVHWSYGSLFYELWRFYFYGALPFLALLAGLTAAATILLKLPRFAVRASYVVVAAFVGGMLVATPLARLATHENVEVNARGEEWTATVGTVKLGDRVEVGAWGLIPLPFAALPGARRQYVTPHGGPDGAGRLEMRCGDGPVRQVSEDTTHVGQYFLDTSVPVHQIACYGSPGPIKFRIKGAEQYQLKGGYSVSVTVSPQLVYRYLQ